MAEAPAKTTRLGVLGSAFNPPHLAHLLLAQEAAYRLELDRVLLVPAARPPHKEVEADPGPELRLAMADLAAGEDEILQASPLEVQRDGPSYTCETLEEIADTSANAEVTLILGADAAAGLAEWHRPERVLELADVAVARRPGTGLDRVEEAFDRLGAAGSFREIGMPQLDISSTAIRRRVAEGAPIRHMTPATVVELIEREGIYLDG